MEAACVLAKTRGNIKGEKKIKFSTYLHYILYYSLALTFAKIFSRYARSITFYHPIKNASMQRDFTNPGYIFFVFLVLLSLTAAFQNALKHD